MHIPFNKPHIPLLTIKNMASAALSGTIAGNGAYTKRCHRYFENKFGFKKVLLTSSCTDALEMAALLCNIQPGDEVILPSFTFMSTANAFLLRGAKLVFADTLPEIPNIDPGQAESLITLKTKAIVVVHYSGIACDMDRLREMAGRRGIFLVEDAAHAIDSYYKSSPLGSIGDFGTFSFHETKNIVAGEGGMISVNNEKFIPRAEIIWEKGTNRAAFFRGEVDKYNWVDIGSSYLPSDAVGAFLFTQLRHLERIQAHRKKIWWYYFHELQSMEEKGWLKRPVIPDYATVNGSMFYILTRGPEEQKKLINHLKKNGISAVFHYFPLHSSPYFREKHDGRNLPYTEKFSDGIVRLPFFYSLKRSRIRYIVKNIQDFYNRQS